MGHIIRTESSIPAHTANFEFFTKIIQQFTFFLRNLNFNPNPKTKFLLAMTLDSCHYAPIAINKTCEICSLNFNTYLSYGVNLHVMCNFTTPGTCKKLRKSHE